MEDLLITTVFITVIFAPMIILEAIKKHKQNRQPSVIRHRYDTVYNWFYQQYAKQLEYDGINVPDFMNRDIIKKAHDKAVYIAQSGKLNKAYRQIKRLNNVYSL